MRLEVNNAAADGDGDGLGAVAGAQLFHDVLDVNFDGLFGDEKFFTDVAVTIPLGDLAENFDFARS